MIRRLIVFAMLASWTSGFQAAGEILSVSLPFVSPKGGYVTQQGRYHTFRIPGMIVAPDGTILLFAEGRRGDGRDPRRNEDAPIDLVMRRSVDNGRTWEPMIVRTAQIYFGRACNASISNDTIIPERFFHLESEREAALFRRTNLLTRLVRENSKSMESDSTALI